MCGRYSLTASPEDVEALFALDEIDPFPPRYNIAPTQPVLTIMAAPPQPEGSNRSTNLARLARWGFIPSWVKDPKDFPLILNARAETAAEKNSFRAALRRRRVLFPASGFYEWRRDGTKKSQAFWVPPKSGGIVAFGGLMETWNSADGSEIDTAAILTCAANADIAPIHDRMPVVIKPEHFARWLDCREVGQPDITDLLAPAAPGTFSPVAISSKVNKVANAGPDVQEPIAESPPQEPAEPAAPASQLKLF